MQCILLYTTWLHKGRPSRPLRLDYRKVSTCVWWRGSIGTCSWPPLHPQPCCFPCSSYLVYPFWKKVLLMQYILLYTTWLHKGRPSRPLRLDYRKVSTCVWWRGSIGTCSWPPLHPQPCCFPCSSYLVYLYKKVLLYAIHSPLYNLAP